jgi:hypothetical protein
MIEMVCRKCGKAASELWCGLCFRCNPDLAAEIDRRDKEEKHRCALYWALRSRVLTIAEMEEVESYDYHLAVEPMQSYNREEKMDEFNAALLQQFKMRLAVERAAK